MKDKGLYERIEAFDIDGGPAALTFTKRLARENGWSSAFAERVVREYKRFVYLAMVAGHPVTPSDEVDQAWHLHMLYTHSYFDGLCGEVLGRQLSHGPTMGGQAEGEKFNDWYERTKSSYFNEFGEEPPVDVWPPSSIRFGDAPHFRRVNTRQNYVVSKSAVRKSALTLTSAAIAVALIAGCATGLAKAGPLKRETVVVLVVLGVIVLIGLIVYFAKKYGSGIGNGSGCGGVTGCATSGGDSGCGGSGCGGGGCGGGCSG